MITRKEALQKYGPIENGKWIREAEFCEYLELSPGISKYLHNAATGAPVTRIYCNRDMAQALSKALALVAERGFASQLKTFDGCLVIRAVRGAPEHFSWHSYALAIDINAATNQLGTAGDMTLELDACFTDAGFISGRNFARQDPMHKQLAQG